MWPATGFPTLKREQYCARKTKQERAGRTDKVENDADRDEERGKKEEMLQKERDRSIGLENLKGGAMKPMVVMFHKNKKKKKKKAWNMTLKSREHPQPEVRWGRAPTAQDEQSPPPGISLLKTNISKKKGEAA